MFSEDYERSTTALGSAQKAMDPNLTDGDLAVLARSEELKIRVVVAERPGTPLTSLVRLASDPAAAVRAAVARNPRADIPLEVRENLANDRSPEVLFALIRCESLPVAVLSKLSRSWNRDVGSAAREQMKRRKSAGSSSVVAGSLGLASS